MAGPQQGGKAAPAQKDRDSHNYMELYCRRLKKPAPQPTNDAAGLICGTRCHGRQQVKGAPQDNREQTAHPAKRMVQGRSHVCSTGDIFSHEAKSRPPSAAHSEFPARFSMRREPQSYRSNLVGGGVMIAQEAEEVRPSRRPTTAAGPHTERVLGWGAEPAEPTYALLANSRRDAFVSSRPLTAPGCVLRSKPLMRCGYEAGHGSGEDVVTYRHSGGICPKEYKLITDRPPAPQRSGGGAPEAARSCYLEARNAMLQNKMRSTLSLAWGA